MAPGAEPQGEGVGAVSEGRPGGAPVAAGAPARRGRALARLPRWLRRRPGSRDGESVEQMSAIARSRAPCAALLALLAAAGTAADRCADLDGAQRTRCEKVVDCMAIDDTEVRRVCLDAVDADPSAPQRGAQAPDRGEPASAAPGGDPSESVPRGDHAPERSGGAGGREPPDDFSAEVTRIHQSILERQLISVDDSYLFVGDDARRGRLKVGQTVEVSRMESRFRPGRNWRIVGPTRNPIEVFRIRCERGDLPRDDRRRCEQMLPQ